MTTETVSVPLEQARPRHAGDVRAVIFGAGIGNVLEWYDFASYAIFAPFFAPQFFSPTDKTAALLSALAIFAVDFYCDHSAACISVGWPTERDAATRWWCR